MTTMTLTATPSSISGSSIVVLKYREKPERKEQKQEVVAESKSLMQPFSVFLQGAGRNHGSITNKTSPAIALPQEQEAIIRHRLNVLGAMGNRAKLNQLLISMNDSSLLSLQDKQQINDWKQNFDQIQNQERRTLALAFFILKFIRPPILSNDSLPADSPWLTWEETACHILQAMLPVGVKADRFLVKCEIGLREKRLEDKRCARSDAAAAEITTTIVSISNRLITQTANNREAVIGQMEQLQQARAQAVQQLDSSLVAIGEQTNQLGRQLLAAATDMTVLGQEIVRQNSSLVNVPDEGINLIERISL